ncbi:MAG: alkaline phosphatase D family protein [Candidatus Thiodiazotropha sp.]
MLDERFYRQSPEEARGDRDAILGEKQWFWFEDILKNNNSKYLVIGLSSTFHDFIGESWEQYPGAFERMRRLLGDRKGRLIISGDVHRNAMYDDSGVMEIVTSAVARNSVVFGKKRENY